LQKQKNREVFGVRVKLKSVVVPNAAGNMKPFLKQYSFTEY